MTGMSIIDPGSEVWQDLHDIEGILGVIVFGSLAREEHDLGSDIDLLVVHDELASLSDLRQRVDAATGLNGALVKVTSFFFTAEALRDEFARYPSFGAHFADEGIVVVRKSGFDNVEMMIESASLTPVALRAELEDRVSQLGPLSRLERFNGEFGPCLARLYSIGRAVVIIKLLENGIHEYSWRRAFESYGSVRPELRGELECVADLRTFYDHVLNRLGRAIDHSPVDRVYVERAIGAIHTIASS